MNFKVNDMIVVTKTFMCDGETFYKNNIGIIRKTNYHDSYDLGVEWLNENFKGHTLEGAIKNGRGWWIRSAKAQIEIIDNNTPLIELLNKYKGLKF
jgi:hypothetical protein